MAALDTADALLLNEDLLEWELKKNARVLVGRPGSFGAVYKAKYAGEPVAVKHVDISLLGGSISQQEDCFLREVSIHHKIRHKHAVMLLGALITEDDPAVGKEYYIIMELLRGSLHGLVLKDTSLLHGTPVQDRIRWLCECANALRYMHAQGIIHGDLKPDNILLEFAGADLTEVASAKAKIADFGVSRLQKEGTLLARTSAKGTRGTPLYMDPALFDGITAISRSSDVYSFGILAWELLTGQVPYQEFPRGITLNGFESAVRDGARPPLSALVPLLPAGVADDVTSLLEACWDGNRERRPTADLIEVVLQYVLGDWESASVSPAAAPVLHTSTAGVGTPRVPAAASELALRRLAGKQDATLEDYTAYALAVLPDGRVAIGTKEGDIAVWSIRTRTCNTTWTGHLAAVKGFAMLLDGRLCSYSEDGTIRAWNVADGTHVTIRSNVGKVKCMVVLSDGRYASCSAYGAGDKRTNFIHVWKEDDAAMSYLEGHTAQVIRLVVLSDGNLVSASRDDTLRLWNAATGECVRVVDTGLFVCYLAVLSDGRVAGGQPFPPEVKVWNMVTGTSDDTIKVKDDDFNAMVALPHNRLACGSETGVITVWNATSGACEHTYKSALMACYRIHCNARWTFSKWRSR
jgi:hypothetical protein